MNYIFSLTTIPSRIDYFKKSFESVIGQTAFDKINKVIVNVDDTITNEQRSVYEEFLKEKCQKAELKLRPAKWRSANKLIWTYMENMDDTIITFDDDKNYPLECAEQLIQTSEFCPDTIIAQESNSLYRDSDGRIHFENNVGLRFGQLDFSKYLSNACLFPPRCFGDGKILTDFEKFIKVTNATHDELWFWIVSTLNRKYVLTLSNTYSYAIDDGVTMPLDDSSLTKENEIPERIKEYNDKVNEVFGNELNNVFDEVPCIIPVGITNYETILYGIPYMYSMLNNFLIEFRVSPSLKKSHVFFLCNAAKSKKWGKPVKIILMGMKPSENKDA